MITITVRAYIGLCTATYCRTFQWRPGRSRLSTDICLQHRRNSHRSRRHQPRMPNSLSTLALSTIQYSSLELVNMYPCTDACLPVNKCASLCLSVYVSTCLYISLCIESPVSLKLRYIN